MRSGVVAEDADHLALENTAGKIEADGVALDDAEPGGERLVDHRRPLPPGEIEDLGRVAAGKRYAAVKPDDVEGGAGETHRPALVVDGLGVEGVDGLGAEEVLGDSDDLGVEPADPDPGVGRQRTDPEIGPHPRVGPAFHGRPERAHHGGDGDGQGDGDGHRSGSPGGTLATGRQCGRSKLERRAAHSGEGHVADPRQRIEQETGADEQSGHGHQRRRSMPGWADRG